MSTEARKCGHQSCRCLVAAEEIFCGPWCEAAKSHMEQGSCECGHPACQEAMTERE